MRIFFSFLLISGMALSAQVQLQSVSAPDILRKIDRNLALDEAVSTATMIIHGRRGSRTIQSRSWIKGRDTAFVEYLKPPREKGKKMLKLGDKLWTYTPDPVDRIITISGHLLRQSVMGSDLSYEDITENPKLSEDYHAEIIGEDSLRGRPCFVLELTAKKKDLAYHRRKIWVDKKRWIPLKEERFARSGRLLKTSEILEVFRINNRWYPKRMTFKDMLSRGEGTEYIVDSIKFGVKIPPYKFTKAALRK